MIAPDLRGLGATARGSGAASLDQYADDMAALLGHLGIENATVAGLSMGGYISFALWRRHRERIAALILADTRAGADSEEGKQGREKNAQLAEAQGPGAIADQMLPKLLAPNAPAALRDEVREHHRIRTTAPASPPRCAPWPRAPTPRRCWRRSTCRRW